ncbi:ParB family protein [Pasteurella multocida]|uniref:ParB family protein n=1 Tax=Pasteurella multocida TaxID=747 RepID=UPI0030D390D0
MAFFNSKSREERAKSMMAALNTPAITSSSPIYQQVQISDQPTAVDLNKKRLITVTLDKLKPYEGNPRRTKNPAYEEIKASIKSRGLDHAPNITQRPGDDFYTIADGGNTRLQALNELFAETKDIRFWSIECVFKPWQGDDEISSELNMIIGHLAENDIRGELSFIEKALGVQRVKTLYEEQSGETLSHRRLAEKLTESGYPVPHQVIARMEQCLTYLYPHIPNVLLEGLGKAQIDKLLGMRNKAENAWDVHRLDVEPQVHFDEIWLDTLSPFDEQPKEFVINDFQDVLITALVDAFYHKIPYETFKLEIDLAEQKLRKLAEKHADILQLATESERHNTETEKEHTVKTAKPSTQNNDDKDNVENQFSVNTFTDTVEENNLNTEAKDEYEEISENLAIPSIQEMNNAIQEHFSNLGFVPGENPEEQRKKEATDNGLEFACSGAFPITHIWKINPNKPLTMEAYSLAVEIADECGIADCIEHIIHEPIDYAFRVHSLNPDKNHSALTQQIHQILTALSSTTDETQDFLLSPMLWFGTQERAPLVSDLMLVRLFRLIRLNRYIKEMTLGGNYA